MNTVEIASCVIGFSAFSLIFPLVALAIGAFFWKAKICKTMDFELRYILISLCGAFFVVLAIDGGVDIAEVSKRRAELAASLNSQYEVRTSGQIDLPIQIVSAPFEIIHGEVLGVVVKETKQHKASLSLREAKKLEECLSRPNVADIGFREKLARLDLSQL